MSRKRHKKPKHNLKFLTVEDTQYKGSFSGKFREDHDIPKPFNEAKAPDYKSHSVPLSVILLKVALNTKNQSNEGQVQFGTLALLSFWSCCPFEMKTSLKNPLTFD
jgi:hypothetical protein